MAIGYSFYLQLLSALVLCLTVHGFTVEDESDLRDELLKDYNREVRPSAVTIIQLQLHVTAINGVDVRNEVFSLSGWWSMVWDDSRLNWTNKYDDIPVVQFNEDRIWSPVLVVSNSINDLSAIDEDSIPLRADREGRVIWSPPALLKVACTMDVTYFPFDTQSCDIEVTSFGYTIKELDINVYSQGLSFTYYQPNGEWDIIETTKKRAEYEEDGHSYARVVFSVKIERKSLYYGVNIILPIVVSSALTLFVFLLPPESGEKIGYCLTVLLAFMVILTLVATELPTTATSTPLLEIYIAIVLVMGGLSVIFSIIVLHIFFLPAEKVMPMWVNRFTVLSMRFFFISRVEVADERKVAPSPSGSTVSASDIQAKHPDGNVENKLKLRRQQSTIKKIDSRPLPQTSQEVTWQMVASVIDGICLRVYTIFLAISTIVIMVLLTA